MSELLQQGIAAARAGDRAEARSLLMRVLEADERDEQAWLWLSGVVDDPNDIRTCLHNVLELNPNNTQARQGLAWVDAKYGPAPAAPEPKPPAPAPPTPVPEQPYDPLAEPVASYTGPTAQLPPETPAATPLARPELAPERVTVPERVPERVPAPAPERVPAPVSPVIQTSIAPMVDSASIPAENPCPYCGTPTMLAQKSCTQCRHSLMMRGEPPEKRSLALRILGGLWIAYGVLVLLGGILGTVGALIIVQSARPAAQGGGQAGAAFPFGSLLPVVIGILIGIVIVRIGRGLLRRERWTYYVVIALSVLGLIGALCNVAQIGAITAALSSGRAGLAPGAARGTSLIVGATIAVIFIVLGLQVIYLLLVALSSRDFFGQPVRFHPTVDAGDDMAHYNSGIAYKNRDMWFMTVQEWYAASRKKPHDKTYLQALGLAFAQLKKLYPTSATYLRDVESYLIARRSDLYALAPELEQINLLG